jgi:hypothetical protein
MVGLAGVRSAFTTAADGASRGIAESSRRPGWPLTTMVHSQFGPAGTGAPPRRHTVASAEQKQVVEVEGGRQCPRVGLLSRG